MELTFFNNETVPKSSGGRGVNAPARLTVAKGGVLQLNKAATELLNIKAGDKIALAQENSDDANWYIFKDAEHGFEVRTKDLNKNGSACFNHSVLSNAVIQSFMGADVDQKSIALRIAKEPTKHKGKLFFCILGLMN